MNGRHVAVDAGHTVIDAVEADGFCEQVFALMRGAGGERYEYAGAVTQLDHALQTAALAASAGASTELVVASLLHDLGHLVVTGGEQRDHAPDVDLGHEHVGARLLARHFGPAVSAPVALHVAAKRYLVATDSVYASRLSPGSTASLAVQGGPMGADEIETFRRKPHAGDAVRLRRWDDAAKEPDAEVPDLPLWRNAIRETYRSWAD